MKGGIKASVSKKKNYYKKVSVSRFEINWNARYFQLKDFKLRFGHCYVPQSWHENVPLGRWVIRQRVYKHRLSLFRIEQLDSIGFVWNTFDRAWEERFRELLGFKERFGHCNVSREHREYTRLRDWVVKQRKDRRMGRERLTAYKTARLNDIGFEWGFTKPGWENQYLALVKFRQEHGHCRVLQGSKEYPALANWVGMQRSRKHTLANEQVERLDTLGFIWAIKPRKG